MPLPLFVNSNCPALKVLEQSSHRGGGSLHPGAPEQLIKPEAVAGQHKAHFRRKASGFNSVKVVNSNPTLRIYHTSF